MSKRKKKLLKSPLIKVVQVHKHFIIVIMIQDEKEKSQHRDQPMVVVVIVAKNLVWEESWMRTRPSWQKDEKMWIRRVVQKCWKNKNLENKIFTLQKRLNKRIIIERQCRIRNTPRACSKCYFFLFGFCVSLYLKLVYLYLLVFKKMKQNKHL